MTTKDHEATKTLSPRRAAFAREYLRDLNGARAARDAGYAAGSASVEASRLLANADVQAEITRQRAILAEQADVTPEKIVAELAAIAFADMGDYVRIIKGVPILNLSELPAGATRALASVDVDELSNGTTRTKIKLYDKHAALVSLAKMFGMLEGDGARLTVNVGGSPELDGLSREQLRAVLDAMEVPAKALGPGEVSSHESEASDAPELPGEAADSLVPAEDVPLTPSGAARTGGEADEPTSLFPSDPP